MNVQRGDPELRRECRTMIDPRFQRGGTIDVSMLDQHLADLRASQLADLPGFYLGQRSGSTFAPGRQGLIRVVKNHSATPFPFLSPRKRHLIEPPRPVTCFGPIWACTPSKSRIHSKRHCRTTAVSPPDDPDGRDPSACHRPEPPYRQGAAGRSGAVGGRASSMGTSEPYAG